MQQVVNIENSIGNLFLSRQLWDPAEDPSGITDFLWHELGHYKLFLGLTLAAPEWFLFPQRWRMLSGCPLSV